jgi:hypothetical protein
MEMRVLDCNQIYDKKSCNMFRILLKVGGKRNPRKKHSQKKNKKGKRQRTSRFGIGANLSADRQPKNKTTNSWVMGCSC